MTATQTETTKQKQSRKAAEGKLDEAQRKGDLTAIKALKALTDTHKSLGAAKEAKSRIEKERKEAAEAVEAAFRDTIEAGLPAKAKAPHHQEKLARVCTAWQSWGEIKSETVELIKEAKIEVEGCQQRFDDAMQDAYQLRLTFK